jgi:hypothetical protein
MLKITKILKWFWHSPTFTTWGNYAVQSLRLILVTPLILTRFDETEIAAWYLFASLNIFGTIISQRLGLTFSRMFAFAMGGASNLAPIKGKREQENDGKPNWSSFERAYGTIGFLNLTIGVVNVLVALGMGWFGLNNLLQGYEAKGVIWLAFGFMQISSLLSFTYQRYAIALQGMNYVALTNRWGIIFSLLSIIAGGLALWVGGGIIALVLVMQFFAVAGVFRNRFLLHSVEEGLVLSFRQYGFDREIFRWAWAPTWKGFVSEFGLNGSLQLTAIIFTLYGSKVEVASFLFALRIMQTITQVAQAPFSSVQPLMSRLMAAGDIEVLRSLIRKRMGYSLALIGFGIVVAAVALPVLMDLIGSKVPFISLNAWLLFGGLILVQRFDILCCSVSAISNHMIYYWENAIAALVSALALFLLKDNWGVYTPIITAILPGLIFMNIGPLRISAITLQQKIISGHIVDFSKILFIYTFAVVLLINFPLF